VHFHERVEADAAHVRTETRVLSVVCHVLIGEQFDVFVVFLDMGLVIGVLVHFEERLEGVLGKRFFLRKPHFPQVFHPGCKESR